MSSTALLQTLQGLKQVRPSDYRTTEAVHDSSAPGNGLGDAASQGGHVSNPCSALIVVVSWTRLDWETITSSGPVALPGRMELEGRRLSTLACPHAMSAVGEAALADRLARYCGFELR